MFRHAMPTMKKAVEPPKSPVEPAVEGFDRFKNAVLTALSAVKLEDVACDPCAVPVCQPQPPAPPPTRFGATRIMLEPDPSNPAITIVEDSPTSYRVFMSTMIDGCANFYAEFITLLKTLDEGAEVMLYISSPGGSLNTGAMIANAIKKSKANITAYALGDVASAAALIWSYAKNRKIADGALLMFHMSSHFDYGNSKAIETRAANVVRYVKEACIDPLVVEGFLTQEESEKIIDGRENFWMTSDLVNQRLEALRHE